MVYDSETITANGLNVRVTYHYDEDASAPWEDCDGVGQVRKSNAAHSEYRSDKKPGERPLSQAGCNEFQFYYDWQAAMATAKAEGWNAEPYSAPNKAARAVQADFDYMRGYVRQDWQFVWIDAVVLDDDGQPVGEVDSLSGVETYKDYHSEQAQAMANEVTQRYLQDLEDARQAAHIAARYQDAQNLGIVETQ